MDWPLTENAGESVEVACRGTINVAESADLQQEGGTRRNATLLNSKTLQIFLT